MLLYSIYVNSVRLCAPFPDFSHLEAAIINNRLFKDVNASTVNFVLRTVNSLRALTKIVCSQKTLPSLDHLAPIIKYLPLTFICRLINNFDNYSLN